MYLILQPYGRRIFFDIAGTDTLYRVFQVETKKEAEEIVANIKKHGGQAIVYRIAKPRSL